MEKVDVIEGIENFQAWRTGEHDNQSCSSEITIIIEEAIRLLKEIK